MTRWPWNSRPRPVLRRRAVEDLVRSLALLIEPHALHASIAARVKELVGCDSVIICGYTPDADGFKVVHTTGAERSMEVLFPTGGTLERWLRANQEPFLIPHPQGAFDYLDESERTALRALAVRACVPIFSSTRLMAILLICDSSAEWQLAEDDWDLLIRIGRQAGLALENAELHEVERTRLRALHQAQQLAVAGQLAATVAHEVRNPLTAIRSTVQYVLQSSTAWERKRQLLERTLEEVDRIEHTVSGVLALSRHHEPELTEIDLVDTVEQSLLLIGAYAQGHAITIERDFDSVSLPILGDARALAQVWMNLCLNACQAMPQGGRILLRCGTWPAATETRPLASFQVIDNGTGMTAEQLERAFDPFFTTKRTGTGLGLPICVDIVGRHGGTLRLESEAGRGTVASVLLPLRMA